LKKSTVPVIGYPQTQILAQCLPTTLKVSGTATGYFVNFSHKAVNGAEGGVNQEGQSSWVDSHHLARVLHTFPLHDDLVPDVEAAKKAAFESGARRIVKIS
jgi:hypothetical protein